MSASFASTPRAARISAEAEVRDRDLGFGSVISRESRQRLLNRDGSFNVIREGLGLLATLAPYQLLLTLSWAGLLGVVALLHLVLSVLFALACSGCGPGARAGPGSHMLGGRFSQA